jgi:hypothetical protein
MKNEAFNHNRLLSAIALALCLALTFGCLAGCGNNQYSSGGGYPAPHYGQAAPANSAASIAYKTGHGQQAAAPAAPAAPNTSQP